jgi:uncharacterized protein
MRALFDGAERARVNDHSPLFDSSPGEHVMAERPLLSISRKDLDSGPKSIRASLPGAWLRARLTPAEADSTSDAPGLSASSDGSVDLKLTPTGGDNFLLQGRVRATLDAQCGRCLGPATVPVDGEVSLMLVPDAKAKARATKGKKSKDSEGEFEFDESEADIATYDGETIVLDELVREAILLEVPISPLCSETCAGISSDPRVADELARARLDPRLSPLAKLMNRPGEKK